MYKTSGHMIKKSKITSILLFSTFGKDARGKRRYNDSNNNNNVTAF